MLTVCHNHLIPALRMMTVPHVEIMAEGRTESCCFCQQKAKVKLFVPVIKSKGTTAAKKRTNRHVAETVGAY